MCLLRPLLYLLLAALSAGSAMAGDADSQNPPALSLKNGLVADSGGVKNSVADVLNYERSSQPPLRANSWKRKLRSREMALDANGDVCYTMRSYQVKPKERFEEGEDSGVSYSTCQLASSFRVRSADAESDVKLK
jgi:hypothetical protein